jgi:hypothetical protein
MGRQVIQIAERFFEMKIAGLNKSKRFARHWFPPCGSGAARRLTPDTHMTDPPLADVDHPRRPRLAPAPIAPSGGQRHRPDWRFVALALEASRLAIVFLPARVFADSLGTRV